MSNAKKTTSRKPRGYWKSETNILIECRNYIREYGANNFTSTKLKANGMASLDIAIGKYLGGINEVRNKLGLLESTQKAPGYWTKENVISECRKYIDKHGVKKFVMTEIAKIGTKGLGSAINKQGGIAFIRKELNLPLLQAEQGKWDDINDLVNACKEYISEHGEHNFTFSKLRELNFSSLVTGLRKHGMPAVKRRLGQVQEDVKPQGYWQDEENILREAKDFIDQHGEENFYPRKLAQLKMHGLSRAVVKLGNDYIRSKLGVKLEKRTRSRSYWQKEENILNEACAFVEKHGEENLKQIFMTRNGYTALYNAITSTSSLDKIREKLGLSVLGLKPRGYWKSSENLLRECQEFCDKYGVDSFYLQKAQQLGANSMVTAIQEYGGGWHAVRQKLGIPSLKDSKRTVNLEKLRNTLRNLQIEGVSGLTPSQMIILLQQGGFNDIPLDQGGDIFKAIASGSLTPQGLIDWGKSDQLSPEIHPDLQQVSGEPYPVTTDHIDENQSNKSPGCIELSSSYIEDQKITQLIHPKEEESDLSALASMDPRNQLRFLDGVLFAADDSEAIAALKSITLHQLWAKAYLSQDDEAEVLACARNYESAQPWTSEVQKEFLSVYQAAKELKLPDGYNYRVNGEVVEPRLMQKHVAVLAKEHRQFLVMSDMGTGKSLAAQLAVKADGAKRILVIPINACVDQWISDFSNQWDGNKVLSVNRPFLKRLANGEKISMPDNEFVVWVVHAQLMSLLRDEEIAALVETLKPDAVIADEIHVFKTREMKTESKRRTQTKKLLSLISERNPDRMVLGLSGTVIVNSLTEGKALLELVTGEQRDDLPMGKDINHAMRMHQALMANGIRQRMENDFTVHIHRPQVDVSHLIDEVKLAMKHPPRQRPLRLERVLIEARIPAVVNAIGDQPTVIATQYVEGFVEPLRNAIKSAGYKVGVHTGQEKFPVAGYEDAIEAFKAGAIQVLIGSIQTICTGIDGLQKVSSNMVIASQPWTSADYQQLMARLARQHQRSSSVTVHIPTTYLEYYDKQEKEWMHWSFCEYRQGILDAKKRLMDAVMDGLMPPEALSDMTEAKVGKNLSAWLERLSNDGALLRSIKEIRVPLIFSDPSEEKKVRRSYGSFSTANGRWNATNSSKLHQRLQADPTEWMLYHTDLDEIRKDWTVDPLQEAISFFSNSSGLVIGDFGCGQAQLAEAHHDRHTIHSFDHIAINEKVTICDCAEHVPLEDGVLDFAVFSLSLMGQNWADQLNEAWRVLKPTGQIFIWTANSHLDIDAYNAEIENRGFKIISSEANFKWQKIWGLKDFSQRPSKQ